MSLVSILIISIIVLIFISNVLVLTLNRNKIYNSTDNIPENKTALILGTSKYLKGGELNPYYKYRLDAAYKLYKSGKVEFLLLSGDNRKKNYNEPLTMKKDLIAMGIPAENIYCDFAGFRTLDSVVRSKLVFGQSAITIVTQRFHIRRALFIARYYRIDAVGFTAKDISAKSGFKTNTREVFARVKLIIDLLTNKKPKFLGKSINIK
jgi:SanA protein